MTDIQIPAVQMVNIVNLKVDGKNPNVMSKEKRAALKESMKSFGFLVPIITNIDYVIADGEHRFQIARELDLREVPVIALEMQEVDRKLIRQIMNKLKGEHEWELDKIEIQFIDDNGATAQLLNLLPDHRQEILQMLDELKDEGAKEEDFDQDIALQKAKHTTIQPGDLFQLGQHKLMCGDSLNKEDIEQLLGEETPDMVFVDPPYNLAFSGTEGQFDVFANDALTTDKYKEFINGLTTNMFHFSKESTSYYICIDFRNYHRWVNRIELEPRINVINCLVWDKVFAGMGYKYRMRHEFIIFAGNRIKVPWYGDTAQEDVFKLTMLDGLPENTMILDKKGVHLPLKNNTYIRIKIEEEQAKRIQVIEDRDITFRTQSNSDADIYEGFSMNYFSQRELEHSEGIIHPTMKPLKLINKTMANSTKINDLIIDYCGGSGSTLIAAEQMSRKAYLMELSPIYCQVIITRWENYTGKKATKL